MIFGTASEAKGAGVWPGCHRYASCAISQTLELVDIGLYVSASAAMLPRSFYEIDSTTARGCAAPQLVLARCTRLEMGQAKIKGPLV
jgi:hypothetical protein